MFNQAEISKLEKWTELEVQTIFGDGLRYDIKNWKEEMNLRAIIEIDSQDVVTKNSILRERVVKDVS